MNHLQLLREHAETFLLPGEFRTVGQPALLVTNESTPAGFYEEIARDHRPDGYLYGPGCGNVLAMLEAFAEPPRGLILVDVDPAVVCAAKMLVAALRRHEEVEAFVRSFFRSGRGPLEELEAEVLAGEPSARLRRAMESQGPRLWKSLAGLTDGFLDAPHEAPTLLEEWAAHLPARGELVPVRAYLARNYAKLHALARADDIAVLCGSMLDPRLLGLLPALPSFAESRHLIYLSNVVDHLLRRAVLASAKARFQPATSGAASDGGTFSSLEAFVEHLNAEEVAPLALSAPAVFVQSDALHDLRLVASPKPPRYTTESFRLSFDLDRLVLRFFESFRLAAPGAGGAPWDAASHVRGEALALAGAAVCDDGERLDALATTLGESLARWPWWNDPSLLDGAEFGPEQRDLAAFVAGDLGHALLLAARGDGPHGTAVATLRDGLAGLASRLGRPDDPALRGRAVRQVLHGQALVASGVLLADEELVASGDALLGSVLGLHDDGWFRDDSLGGVGAQAEALLRLAWATSLRPEIDAGAALTETARRLLGLVGENGTLQLDALPTVAAVDGYGAWLARPRATCDGIRLAFLFHGFCAEEGTSIEAALQVSHHLATRNTDVAPDTDVLLANLR